MKSKLLIMLSAGLVLLAACKGKTGSEEFVRSSVDTSIKGTIDRIADTVATPKLIKTADMRLKVKNVQKTCEDVSALTVGYNGMVMHHKVESNEVRSTDTRKSEDSIIRVTAFSAAAEITVKIPSDKLDEFMNKVERLGLYINNRQMDVSDKTLDYLSARMKLKNRAELIARQKSGKVVIKNPANVLLLKDDMVDQQISNRQIDDEVKNSIVSLGFYQSNTIYKETIADDDPTNYRPPFFTRMGFALGNGWALFEDVIVGLGNLWMFVIAGLGIWMLIRYYSRKRVLPVIKG